MTPLVEVVGLTKYYGSKRGVIDLSFQVAEGEVYGAPLVDGLRPPRVLGLLGVVGATLTMATVRFTRKDLAR